MTSASSISNTILNEIGWDSGLSIPVANSENKALESELQKCQQQKLTLEGELDDHVDRVNAMLEHLKNVRQELHLTQALHEARKKEQETELHMIQLAEREEGRLKQELDRLRKELNTIKERENMCENNKFRLTQRLEEIKSEMNWDQQALQAWLEESARKDEDAMIIEKYSRQDEIKIKELNGKIGYMVEEAHKRKRHLDQEHTETQMVQLELDKTAEEFRLKHAERQDLLHRWQQTIEQMQKRDDDMDLLAEHLSTLRLERRKKEALMKEKEQFYENEKANNKDFEKKIGLAERTYSRLKAEYQDLEQQRDNFHSELEVLKRTVDRTASDLESTRAQLRQMKQEYAKKEDHLKAIQRTIEELKVKLKKTIDQKLTAEERSKMMEQTMRQEERNQEALLVEVKQLGDLKFRRGNELAERKNDVKILDTENQGIVASLRNYSSKITQLDNESLKQMEVVYMQDFNIQSLERRLGRLRGEHSNEETVELETKIRELTEELAQRVATRNMLIAQNKNLSDDLRRTKYALQRTGVKKAKMTEKISDINLQLDNAHKEHKRLVVRKQDVMVDANVLKLEVKRKREMVYKTVDGVVNLERSKMAMEAAMRERREEIAVHIEMLRQQIRAADSERHSTSSEVHERISRIDKLKKRFEILTVSMAPPEGEEEKSQAYYVIKAAQEKEELQREGDELDANIRKSEKEIHALGNTLRLLNNRNEVYRRSQFRVKSDETGGEMEEKQQLEEQLRAYNDKKRYKKRQIRELQEDLQVMQRTMENLCRDNDAYNETIQEKRNRIGALEKESKELECKVERAEKMNEKIAHVIRPKPKEECPEESDFDVRVMRDVNQMALKRFADAVQQFPEMSAIVSQLFTEANLTLPSAPGSGAESSRASSSTTHLTTRSGSLLSLSSTRTSSSCASVKSGASSVKSAASSKLQIECGRPLPSTVNIGDDLRVSGSSKPSPASSKSSVSSQQGLRSGRSDGSGHSARSGRK